jgi:hypothetical protein
MRRVGLLQHHDVGPQGLHQLAQPAGIDAAIP